MHNIHGNSHNVSFSRAAGPSAAAPVLATNANANANANGANNNRKAAVGASPAAVAAPNPAATGQEFIIQLATTRKMLYNILEKHDAVPDRVSYYYLLLFVYLISLIPYSEWIPPFQSSKCFLTSARI